MFGRKPAFRGKTEAPHASDAKALPIQPAEDRSRPQLRPSATAGMPRSSLRTSFASAYSSRSIPVPLCACRAAGCVPRLCARLSEIASESRLQLNEKEQNAIASDLLDDMVGVGPIEPLLKDHAVTDILVNGPNRIFVERHGRLELTGLKFRDEAHVLNVAQRIAASVGRRVDESSPMVDARLADGSRVNVIVPPLALDGASISIRRFNTRGVTLEWMANNQNLSHSMARVLGDRCGQPDEHSCFRRHGLGQNDASQRACRAISAMASA